MLIGVCDDIPEYVNQLTKYVKNYFSNSTLKPEIKTFSCGTDLMKNTEELDILFLDIELGDYNAIDLVSSFRSKYRSTILIMVTSYEQYLDDAMDLDILRYIDKPISEERIISALNRATEILDNTQICIVGKKKEIFKINKRDIIYIESYLRNVYIHTVNETIITNVPLKELRAKVLTTSYFAVPHNSFIVNLSYIKLYSRSRITMNVGVKTVDISISSRHQANFKQAYLEYMKEGYCNVKNNN